MLGFVAGASEHAAHDEFFPGQVVYWQFGAGQLGRQVGRRAHPRRLLALAYALVQVAGGVPAG